MNANLRAMRRRRFRVIVLPLFLTIGGLAQPHLAPAVDRIVVVKGTRTMTLMRGDEVLKRYVVALGAQPIGQKERDGDHKTPEGEYVIDWKEPQSRFHLALHVSYPNGADRARANRLGVSTGGSIMIHGLEKKDAWVGALHRQLDWTDGCIAVTNAEIEEVFRLVPVGTRVEIKP